MKIIYRISGILQQKGELIQRKGNSLFEIREKLSLLNEGKVESAETPQLNISQTLKEFEKILNSPEEVQHKIKAILETIDKVEA